MSLPTDEIWRPIPDYEGFYEASSLGRVRSLERTRVDAKGRRRHYPTRVLRPGASGKIGYLSVVLSRGAEPKTYMVHYLVTAAFYGPRPPGPAYVEIRHLDGDPLNNTPGNLRYGSRSENQLDMVRHGTHKEAKKTHCKRGHPFNEMNTRHHSRGRACIPCERAKGRWRYWLQKTGDPAIAAYHCANPEKGPDAGPRRRGVVDPAILEARREARRQRAWVYNRTVRRARYAAQRAMD